MSTATLVDKEYETIVGDLTKEYRNIEPYLLIKSAMLRRKYPAESKQHFWLEIFYNEGADIGSKSARVYSKIGRVASYHGHNHYLVDLHAKLDDILDLASSDQDIRLVAGEVFPLSA